MNKLVSLHEFASEWDFVSWVFDASGTLLRGGPTRLHILFPLLGLTHILLWLGTAMYFGLAFERGSQMWVPVRIPLVRCVHSITV